MNIRNRKTPRAKWHDYNGAEYFVTICTKNIISAKFTTDKCN